MDSPEPVQVEPTVVADRLRGSMRSADIIEEEQLCAHGARIGARMIERIQQMNR